MIDQEFDCEFVLGDNVDNIKKMDYAQLKHKVTEVHNVHFKYGYYQKGVLSFINKGFDTFLMTGDIRCISTWLFLFAALFHPRKRVFIWCHGFTGKETYIKKSINKLFFGLTNGAFLYNERSKDLMVKNGFSGQKLYTIYNSLDYDAQLEFRKQLNGTDIYKNHFQNNEKTIVFIGRLIKEKKMNLLFDAIHVLKKEGFCFNVVLIGDGPDKSLLLNHVKNLDLEPNVWFYGACYDENQNAELVYNSDLCVVPGDIGLTAIHCLMFGVPVITHDDFRFQGPEFEAIVRGKTGDFFKSNDVDSLAGTIKEWFAQHKDRDTIRKECYKEIDSKWNPHNQLEILKSVLL